MVLKTISRTACLCLGLFAAGLPADAQPVAQGLRTATGAAAGQVQCLGTSARETKAALVQTNEIRRSNGLPALRANPKLVEAAARHACDMARRGQMTHAGSSTRGPSQRVKALGYRMRLVAENIAMGYNSTGDVMQAWRDSQGHLQNIMLPQTRDFGIGRAIGADGRTVYWAAVYGVSQ
ncbi:CAP domain-containing protein [Paracoccus aminophilus]|uniref:SCP-like extracellular protein n=1 Tax=Paracoccus aminophilus JCM 7686 TaxID=1367847 RepID=S5YQW7_PARAH|nr:CAP domain-containing protein [Paracoccus aminophilus]AGT07646.1 SCP-like extracellular protein [Paracoccus aminophilus JCM 7686]